MPHAPRTTHRRACAAVAVACAVVPALAAPAAEAGVAETPNACRFFSSNDTEYRTQNVEITASAPASAEPGRTFTLTGQELEIKLRQQLAQDAAAIGLIPANGQPTTVATRTWVALRGTNTKEGTQVVGPISVNATTTVTEDPSSTTYSATPWAYIPPRLPDTTWTATGGTITFSQAGPGAIDAAKGQLPVGGSNSPQTVSGSAVTQANLPQGANFYMDCQPGETIVTRPEAGAGTAFTPRTAAPFATVAVAGPPSNPGGVTDPAVVQKVKAAASTPGRVASTRLSGRGGTIRVRVSCAGQRVRCRGTLTIRTTTPKRIGRRAPKLVTMARVTPYTVAAGRTRTIAVKLGADAKLVLRRTATQRVRVTLKPARGRAAAKQLTLKR